MNVLEDAIKEFTFPKCHEIKNRLVSRFIEFRCKNLGTYLSKQIKKKKDGAILKASKSVAMRETVKKV